MISCTSGWRTTSRSVKPMKRMPGMPREVAGEKAELLASLHGGTGQNDTAETVLHQLRDGHRHREVCIVVDEPVRREGMRAGDGEVIDIGFSFFDGDDLGHLASEHRHVV